MRSLPFSRSERGNLHAAMCSLGSGSTAPARSAGCGLVLFQSQPSRLASPGGEFIEDLSTATEVHLVRGLPFERAVRDPLVVLDHVERDGRDILRDTMHFEFLGIRGKILERP